MANSFSLVCSKTVYYWNVECEFINCLSFIWCPLFLKSMRFSRFVHKIRWSIGLLLTVFGTILFPAVEFELLFWCTALNHKSLNSALYCFWIGTFEMSNTFSHCLNACNFVKAIRRKCPFNSRENKIILNKTFRTRIQGNLLYVSNSWSQWWQRRRTMNDQLHRICDALIFSHHHLRFQICVRQYFLLKNIHIQVIAIDSSDTWL